MKEFWTKTMAELYVSQGHLNDALEIYEYLLAKDPGNTEIKSRIEQLTGQDVGIYKNRRKISALKTWLEQVKERAALHGSGRNS